MSSSTAHGPLDETPLAQPAWLGSFAVERPLGRGGMGEVWAARHRASGLAVAVKTITADALQTPEHRQAFAREVRAVAALDHPSVVRIFDHGIVDAEAEAASEGRLAAGNAWLVMELAGGGTLKGMLPTTWAHVRDALGSVLGALAHAHARGVIHRDLKASNVLVAGPDDLRPGLKLADFGAVHRIDRDRGEDDVARRIGTPHAMAPEQIEGEDHGIGPATDLYALGCLGWWLATGRRVFEDPRADELLMAQLHQEPGAFEPMVVVPDGFEGWLRRLLRKRPEQRFATAAAAARGLMALGEAGAGAAAAPPPSRPPAEASTQVVSLGTDATVVVDAGPARARAEVAAADAPAPVPVDWRPGHGSTATTLVGAGLGLFGLRRLPLVGREDLQDALWAELRGVADRGDTRLVLLRGQAGAGKSELARWLLERAAEVGAAVPLWAAFDAGVDAEAGFAALVRRSLRARAAVDAVAPAADERLLAQGVEDVSEWKALVNLAMPGHAVGGVALAGEARFAALARFLEREARSRPAVIWFDDAHASRQVLGFLAWLRRRAGSLRLPALVVATVRDDLLADDPGAAAAVDGLGVDAQWVVPPLAPDATRELVSDLLHLSGDLAEQVAERSAGTPLFAVQVVADWVARGALQLGAAGFELADGQDARLPDSIDALFRSALSSALGTDEPPGWLSLAAALGNPTVDGELEEACRQHGSAFDRAQVDRLVRRGLLQRTEEGWAFAHGLLVESIDQATTEAEARRGLHLACVAALRVPGDGAEPSARIGRHLLAAGETEAALEPLLAAIDQLYVTSGYDEALALLDLRDGAVAELGFPHHDRRRLLGELARAAVVRETPRFAEASEAIERLRPALEASGEPDLLAWGLLILARARASALDIARSQAALDELQPLRGHLRVRDRFAERLLSGFLAERRNEPELARRIYDAARPEALAAGDLFSVVQLDVQRSSMLEKSGRPDEGIVIARAALAMAEKQGFPRGAGSAWQMTANNLRKQGRYDEAAQAYRNAIAAYTKAGSAGGDVALNNLGGMLLQQGRWTEARPVAEQTRRIFRAARRRPWAAMAVTMQALSDAGERKWAACWRRLAEARQLLEPCSSAQSGSAQMAEKAADLAQEAGEIAVAERALELAVLHWERIGRVADVARVAERMEGLQASGDGPRG